MPIAEVPRRLSDGDGAVDRPVVLVVDPEPDIADAVAEILNRNGYAAIPSYDAEDAVETALLIPPALVVADIRMPARNGIEVATVLKAKLPDCKVLLLSGPAVKLHPAAIEGGSGHEAAGISAPVQPAELLARISAHIKLK